MLTAGVWVLSVCTVICFAQVKSALVGPSSSLEKPFRRLLWPRISAFTSAHWLRVTLVIQLPGNAALPYIFHQDTLLLAAAGLKIAPGGAAGCVAAGEAACVSGRRILPVLPV